ncbi:Di-copper centre-containing protein [Ascobolus immersus RN42]|uniref:Di-copper centre-containing protein n=1 Tax=Ascobolus immersus RN42 TaxID=1160509 RepID=A0A3N4HND3_ASCIM|nr:Di-copper centre-containing protein [Ascobolus immersus RN42]
MGSASAAAIAGRDTATVGRCSSPLVRKEWRTLTGPQKAHFLDAVQCLHNAEPQLTTVASGTGSRFEDFIVEHKVQTDYIHQVGHFLPWHRLFLAQFERVLRAECNYTGALPYWDYSLDAADISQSPVFDPASGFGGNGIFDEATWDLFADNYCVGDGPFADWTINIASGNNTAAAPRCLARNLFAPFGQGWLTAEREAEIKSKTDFGSMVWTMEGEPDFEILGMHGAGHWAIGGSAANVYTSNSEPLFYLHHANLDRIWAEWQAANPSTRQFEIDGSVIPRHPEVFAGDYTGMSTGNVTLAYPINLGTLGGPSKSVTILDVMDTKGGRPATAPSTAGGVLCYEYAASPAASQ